MPAPTYTLINSVTLTNAVASVTVTGLPQTYGDLVLVVNAIRTAGPQYRLRFNNDSNPSYNAVTMTGVYGSARSDNPTNATSFYLNDNAGDGPGGLLKIQIQDYSATDKHKSGISRFDNLGISVPATLAGALRYASTSAITEVNFILSSGSYQVGSTFKIYGIAKDL
jgi:hypothetical protein